MIITTRVCDECAAEYAGDDGKLWSPLPAEGEPRRLTVAGVTYELDVCGWHDARFDRTLDRFTAAARKTVPQRKQPPRSTAQRQQTAAIRAWAKTRGMAVKDAGRLPAAVTAAWAGNHHHEETVK